MRKIDMKFLKDKKVIISIVIVVVFFLVLLLSFLLRGEKEKTGIDRSKKLTGIYISDSMVDLPKNSLDFMACAADGFICVSDMQIIYDDDTRGIINFTLSYQDNRTKVDDEEETPPLPEVLSGLLKVDLGYTTARGAFRTTYSFYIPYNDIHLGHKNRTMHGYNGFDLTSSDRINTYQVTAVAPMEGSMYDNIPSSNYGSIIVS